jgi:hypothetical protein
MGGFYVTYTVRGADQEAVVAAFEGRQAMVSPVENGAVVVWDEESNHQDEQVIQALGRFLSERLESTVLAAMVHDDDIFLYWLFTDGKIADAYNSNPSYFLAGPSLPSGGDAAKLCEAFQSGKTNQVEEILRCTMGEDVDDDRYVFESERHQALVDLLGLPSLSVGFTFWQVLEQANDPRNGGFVKVG